MCRGALRGAGGGRGSGPVGSLKGGVPEALLAVRKGSVCLGPSSQGGRGQLFPIPLAPRQSGDGSGCRPPLCSAVAPQAGDGARSTSCRAQARTARSRRRLQSARGLSAGAGAAPTQRGRASSWGGGWPPPPWLLAVGATGDAEQQPPKACGGLRPDDLVPPVIRSRREARSQVSG